jgi:hypothetical protein
MNLYRLLGIAVLFAGASASVHADDSPGGMDRRLVGSWKFSNYMGTLVFHTSFANGDFKRSVYDHGKFKETSKGRWSTDGKTFHIVLLKRATFAHPDRFADIDQRIDQQIIEISADSYVVHEPSAAGDGLMRWIRIGVSDVSQYKADEPDPTADPAPAPTIAPSAQASRQP